MRRGYGKDIAGKRPSRGKDTEVDQGGWRAHWVFEERITQARLRGAWSWTRALECLVEEFEFHSEVSQD